jgi:hypothetical protein
MGRAQLVIRSVANWPAVIAQSGADLTFSVLGTLWRSLRQAVNIRMK